MDSRSFYITTPIYYANAPLHVGSAFEIIGIDVLARFRRLVGDSVFFLTGMDEHGEKNQKAAEERGITPQQHVDEMAEDFAAFCRTLEISQDDIIRTTEPRHRRGVDAFWRKAAAGGDIYLDEYSGLYCSRCESYVRETDLRDGNCPACGDPPKPLSEPAYFFRLSRYEDRLRDLFNNRPEFIQPDFRRNEMMQIVESGLQDICISRSSIHWGISVPDAAGHVVYVWFDALTNYITALGYPDEDGKFGQFWPADVHVVGKDILRFHAIYWPAMLMAAGLEMPRRVFGHGFIYAAGGDKMSKSIGNVVAPEDIIAVYGADALRYFLLRETPYAQDGEYSETKLADRHERDLANDLGNLVLRTVSMIGRYRQGRLPAPVREGAVLAEQAAALKAAVPAAMDALQFNRSLELIWGLVHRANRFVEERRPWDLNKDAAKADRLDATLYELAETVRILSVWLTPFLPAAARGIREQLGLAGIEGTLGEEADWGRLPEGQPVHRGEPLFPRIERVS